RPASLLLAADRADIIPAAGHATAGTRTEGISHCCHTAWDCNPHEKSRPLVSEPERCSVLRALHCIGRLRSCAGSDTSQRAGPLLQLVARFATPSTDPRATESIAASAA